LPFPKAHGKVLYRVKMSRAPFAVRFGKRRTAKAVPCVFVPAHGKDRDSGSVSPVQIIVICTGYFARYKWDSLFVTMALYRLYTRYKWGFEARTNDTFSKYWLLKMSDLCLYQALSLVRLSVCEWASGAVHELCVQWPGNLLNYRMAQREVVVTCQRWVKKISTRSKNSMDGTSRPGPRLAGQEYGRIPFSYGRRQVKSRQYRPSRSYNDSYISYICNHDVPPPFRILRSRQKSERRDPKLLNSAFFFGFVQKNHDGYI
jgi:hypothetical protein